MALLLLTASVILGIVDFSRWRSERWPRFVTDALHRNVSLLALAVVSLHIVTTVADSFAPIGLKDAIIPFLSAYRPLWLGLGALSFDVLLAFEAASQKFFHAVRPAMEAFESRFPTHLCACVYAMLPP